MLSDIETLMAIEQIRRLKARYFRFLDGKNWDEFGRLFVENATMDARQSFSAVHPKTGELFVHGNAELVKAMNPNDMMMSGAANIAAKGAELFPEVITMHHGHMSEIDIESENSARAIWAMKDRLLFLSAASPIREIHGFGHYHETYGRFEGEWKILTSRLSRIRVDVS